MNGTAPDLEHDPIHEVSQGFLRFSPAIELEFERDTAEARTKHIINTGFIGLSLYHLFLIADYRQIPDVFWWSFATHFTIVTPVYLGLMALVTRRRDAFIREGALFVAIILMIVTILVICDLSRAPDRDLYLFNLTIVTLFATFLMRMRFKYTIAVSLFTMVGYAFAIARVTSLSADRILSFDLLMFSILVLLLIGSYSLEVESRAVYLLRVRDRIRNAELEALGLRDALTGVGNRRALDAAFARLTASRPDGVPVSAAILMLDIDHFKAFNDLNGHQAGDLCLKRVADTVMRVAKKAGGEVYRFGGEEFVVVLETAQPELVRIVSEAIRAAVANEAIPRDPAGESFVTVSIGTTIGDLGGAATPVSLIAAADDALYSAKRSGRNQVCAEASRVPATRVSRQTRMVA